MKVVIYFKGSDDEAVLDEVTKVSKNHDNIFLQIYQEGKETWFALDTIDSVVIYKDEKVVK